MDRVEERELLRAAHWALRSYEHSRRISVEDLAHAEFLLIHPFREGNGRLARLLAKLMAMQAGVEIAGFDALAERRRDEYFAAVRAGLDRNYRPMRELFSAMIDGAGA